MSDVEQLRTVSVWDRTTRWFHWINVLAVLSLACLGTMILYADELSIPTDGEIVLKKVHVLIGYVFCANLAWRLVWAFVGGRHARWSAFIPFRKGFGRQVREQAVALARRGRDPAYAGHSPLGRLAVTALLLLLLNSAVTGLVIAGTDIFYPPFGSYFATWVAAPGVDAADVVPGRPELVDQDKRAEMRAFRAPFKKLHEYGFYVLGILVLLHVAGVVIAEVRGGGGLVSAMFTGRKVLRGPPVDESVPNA